MIKAILTGLLCANTAQAQVVFSDQSSTLPPHQYTGGWEHFVGGGVAIFDCDHNGLPDVFIAGGTTPAALWRNLGDFQFEAMSLPDMTGVTGAYPLDISGRNRSDLYVMRVGPDKVLASNGDCTFEDATDNLGIPQTDQWTTAFTAWWENDIGPILAVGHYVDRADPDGPFEACDTNTLLYPSAGKYDDAPRKITGFCALSMLTGRDARGRQTLRISNDRHYYINDGHEQMWDTQEQRFLGPDDGWNNVSLWGMGIGSVDLNGDGRDEVMLTSMGDQLLQLAQPDGTYAAAPFDIGTYAQRPHVGNDGRPSTGWHSEFGDVNNDGLPDLFIAKGNVDQMPGMAMEDPNNLLIQSPDGTFDEAAAVAGIATTERSRGAGFADFDQDGRLDLIVVNRRAPVEIYRNETQAAGHWLRIDLRQYGPNTHAVGAIIRVVTTERTQHREIRIGGGHAGGQSLPLHIGLGTAKSATVQVTWPDGRMSEHAVDANQTVKINKP